MVLLMEVLPGLKRFVQSVRLSTASRQMVQRIIIAFVLHTGRMSCQAACTAIRSEACHRAQIGRFLGRKRWRQAGLCGPLRQQLLDLEPDPRGRWLFIVDATLHGQQGRRTENTYSTGNSRRRPRKGRRHGTYKYAARSCHYFTAGLLISPSGHRIPFLKPYRTRDYCQQHGLVHRTTAEAAADMIRELPLPDGADVVVLGDTAYESCDVHRACDDRGFLWIAPLNPERVLAGPQGQRPKVRSLVADLGEIAPQTFRLGPGCGKYVAQRRLSPHRIGSKAKCRTLRVHEERRQVHSLGEVRLVFSTRKPNFIGATLEDVKILVTNAGDLPLREVVELYLLRWQIELFFKELKSHLGFCQYCLRQFARVEAWADLAIAAFLYLEWYRARQLARRGLSEEHRRWWQSQRTCGLCQAVRQASEQAELKYVADRLETPGGLRRLKKHLRACLPGDQRLSL